MGADVGEVRSNKNKCDRKWCMKSQNGGQSSRYDVVGVTDLGVDILSAVLIREEVLQQLGLTASLAMHEKRFNRRRWSC